jgi:hypothetical protein
MGRRKSRAKGEDESSSRRGGRLVAETEQSSGCSGCQASSGWSGDEWQTSAAPRVHPNFLTLTTRLSSQWRSLSCLLWSSRWTGGEGKAVMEYRGGTCVTDPERRFSHPNRGRAVSQERKNLEAELWTACSRLHVWSCIHASGACPTRSQRFCSPTQLWPSTEQDPLRSLAWTISASACGSGDWTPA